MGADPTIVAHVRNESDEDVSGTVGGELQINGEEVRTKYQEITVAPDTENLVNLIFNTVEIPESAETSYSVWIE